MPPSPQPAKMNCEDKAEPNSTESIASSMHNSQANSQKKSGTKSSWVWHYFIEKKTEGRHYLVCQAKAKLGSNYLCLAELTRDKTSSTKSMTQHLAAQHGITSTAVREESGINMEKYGKEGRILKLNAANYKAAVTRLIVMQELPFSLVNSVDF
ncbi:hypothetical protein DFH28DRAFT_932364 [Melampsora americana]|nr:hypothetical protein DFH28DRAFT_932364 [Melampsora americana]